MKKNKFTLIELLVVIAIIAFNSCVFLDGHAESIKASRFPTRSSVKRAFAYQGTSSSEVPWPF